MNKNKKMSIVGIMLMALVASFIVGSIFMYAHDKLIKTGNDQIWETIYSIFFQDITVSGAKGVGIFYVIGTLFMNALRLTIVPLVFTSLILAMSSITDLKKLGRIAYKGVLGFLVMYIIGCIFAGTVAILARNLGWISVSSSITAETSNIVKVGTANPLSIFIAMVPQNLLGVLSDNNNVLAVVFIAVVLGISIGVLGEKTSRIKALVEEANEIIQLCIGFLINKIGPIAIFSLIVRAFAIYGLEQLKPVLIYVVVTIVVLLIYLIFGYSIIVALTTKLNPFIFMKKMTKVALIAFSTASSSPALPLNLKTNTEELGVSSEIANFILPLGMTINMNGTSIMHVIGTIFIATASGYTVTIPDLLMMSMLSILAAAGTPALPAAGTVLLFTVLNGMGYVNETALIIYSLILAINKPVEMVLTTLNVVGDAATSLIVANSENELDKDIYYDKKI
ncbi:dicarboxylate/amino acid:cation symporter [Clostridium sp.]|jgi:Na+/H+-dicarboxylate symporter|uniref:dicarboxylate/amino acid:cation symporter n=1 Tax=Clostridium sp. TaxID=1506 RepID=UPI00258BDBBD|nr:dicarboxylate/amino acid:cation symporter [Clostridium sp.]MDF2505287.1 sodium:dicarboxylate symporter [Clostridium sp.]